MMQKLSELLPRQIISNKRPFSSGLTLKPGETFRGYVLQEHEGGEVTISARGRLIRARSEINLSKGTTYHFQVKSSEPIIKLKVISGLVRDSESPSLIWASARTARQRFGNILNELVRFYQPIKLHPDTLESFQKLRQILPAIVFNGNNIDDTLWCSKFLLKSGLFWENKIIRLFLGGGKNSWKEIISSDLKGILLSMAKFLKAENDDNDVIKAMSLKVDEAISIIEQDQLLNLSCIKADMGFWFIPGSTEEGFKGADLFVKELKELDGIRYILLMEFSMLGRIEMDVSIVNSVTAIKILCEDSVITDFIKENLPVLEKALHDNGIITGGILCDVMDGQDYQINPFSNKSMVYSSVHVVA